VPLPSKLLAESWDGEATARSYRAGSGLRAGTNISVEPPDPAAVNRLSAKQQGNGHFLLH